MDQAVGIPGFGTLLRGWRRRRQLSQLELALQAEVSTRHLSWLEAGKSVPSRAMVLRLAERLAVPLRERNALLRAAGYAPLYAERPLADPALGAARQVLQRLLDAHEPNPALAVDRHWNLVAANRLLPALLQGVDAALLQPPLNVLRLALHPQGLAPRIANLPQWRTHVLARLQRQIDTVAAVGAAGGDPTLATLHAELRALPGGLAAEDFEHAAVALPLQLESAAGTLHLISTLTVFGAPHDITLSEIAVESFFPADETSAARLRALLGG